MKTISKIRALAVAAACAGLAFAPSAMAVQRPNSSVATGSASTTAPKTIQNTFCTRLANAGAATQNRLTEKYQQVTQARQNTKDALHNRREERDQNMEQAREQAASTTKAVMQQLLERAQTEAQKQAIVQFQQQVRTAAAARKAAVDAAMEAFRKGLDAEAANRETLLQNAASKYKTAVQTALNKAQSDCQAGQDTVTAKTALNNALRAAQAELQKTKQNLDNRGGKVRTLTQTRNQAVKKAADDFKAAMEQARIQLKAAFQAQTQTQASGTPDNQ
ncbi:MAG: hypothetical protein M1383_00210 [Patescibacteria group bacterium]|nr:hypothetical protein [Patescibacteria group bacterium]